ncbi:MAG: hypothetical protein JWM68_3777 [Verrucomicrobiales bacterium]|nr:hypothetical protein [Verrucomicrobiales bacterium]
MPTKVLIGTASWQEPEFIEHWYPKGLPKSRLLPYYAEHFGFVEVNGSFYGIPQAKSTAQWCEQTPDDFVFNVKLHRLLSRHSTEAKFLPADLRPRAEIVNGKVLLTSKLEKLIAQKFIAGLEPLLAAKKLGTLLLQLAPSFRPKLHALEELDNVLSLFGDFDLAVELRNRFWLEGEQTDATVQFFKERKVTLVSVDAPPESEHFTVMPNLDFVTRPDVAYFRLHGRNEEAYVKGRTVADRFNYNYSDEELVQFSTRVMMSAETAKAIYIVLNNNRHRFAPDAALRLMKILEKQPNRLQVVRPRSQQFNLV